LNLIAMYRDLQAERDLAKSGTADTLRPVALVGTVGGGHASQRTVAEDAPSRRAAWITALAGTLIVAFVGGGAFLTAKPRFANAPAAGAEAPPAATMMAAPLPAAAAPIADPVSTVAPESNTAAPESSNAAEAAAAAAGTKVARKKARRGIVRGTSKDSTTSGSAATKDKDKDKDEDKDTPPANNKKERGGDKSTPAKQQAPANPDAIELLLKASAEKDIKS
jgi:hypothetical protein